MQIPKNMTETEVLEVFTQVTKKLGKKFKFGYRDEEDMIQEAMILCIEGLDRYDGKRPLANFLYIHVRNRLCNYKRKHYIRIEKPCTRCPLKAFLPPDKCKEFDDMMDCNLYERWHERNIVKRNLANTLEYNQVDYKNSTEENMKYNTDTGSNMDKKEILNIIDKDLPINLRKSYTMMLNGIKIHKKDEDILKATILEILKENGIDV